MPILDCSVRSCYYNHDNQCSLDRIHVEGRQADDSEGTACGSFRLKDTDGFTNACECGRSPKDKLKVECEAVKCYFNEDCKCTAEHIGIAGSSACTCGETECASFEMD